MFLSQYETLHAVGSAKPFVSLDLKRHPHVPENRTGTRPPHCAKQWRPSGRSSSSIVEQALAGSLLARRELVQRHGRAVCGDL